MAIPNTTPTPNKLFNTEMLEMKDTELRVVMVVTRATFGWVADKDSGLRKEEDWISLSQMETRSGKSARALNMAIRVCVEKGWIEARSESGERLDTSEKRMKHGKKIFYRLGPTFLKDTPAKIARVNPRKKHQGTPAKSAPLPPQKVRTTKETLTKETPTKESPLKNPSPNGEIPKTNGHGGTAKRLAEVFEHYLAESGETQTRLTRARKDKIRMRLNTYSMKELKKAITQCYKDPFYSGDNDRGWRANIDYITRNDEIVERLLFLKPKKSKTHVYRGE